MISSLLRFAEGNSVIFIVALMVSLVGIAFCLRARRFRSNRESKTRFSVWLELPYNFRVDWFDSDTPVRKNEGVKPSSKVGEGES